MDRRSSCSLIATFGQARLIKNLDFKYELVGGSEADRAEAQEWISKFMQNDVVQRISSPRPPEKPQ